MTALTRRQALRLLAGSAFAAGVPACGGSPPPARVSRPPPDGRATDATRVVVPAPPPPPPTPTPRPVEPPGRVERTLLPDSEWATPLSIAHSGVEGPRVLVLGGVHGNEAGGWLAAEEIASWEPSAGSLLVVPRANVVATHAFVRTRPELGDLNRLYPGDDESPLPMSRMAAAIVAVAREFEVELALDLHESWGFLAEHEQRGTAFIGQTVTKGSGPLELATVRAAVDAVNEQITEREQLTMRDREWWRRSGDTGSTATFDPAMTEAFASVFRRRSSSLSLGSYVPGLTPVLIEMGQERQPEWRRSELHQLFVRTTLEGQGAL